MPSPKPASTSSSPGRGARARRALLLGGGLVLLLYVLPFGRVLLWPLVLLSTLAHEAGHGIAAVLVGGTFVDLSVFIDGSGIAHKKGVSSPLGLAIVSAGGLVGPSFVAAFLFVTARSARLARITLVVGALILFALLALVVRNAFGIAFTGLFAVGLLAVAWRVTSETAQGVVVFLALVLSISVFSRSDYLFAREAVTGAGTLPSDTMHIALALGGPHLMWGVLVGAFSIAVLIVGALIFAWRLDDA
jgi:hypothetical protein